MANLTTTTATFPMAPSPSITTRQRDTYMLIGFLFLSLAGIIVFLCFIHRKCRDSGSGIKQWFLSMCCTSRIMRSASCRLRRHDNMNKSCVEEGNVADDLNNNSDNSYLNPVYSELTEENVSRGYPHHTKIDKNHFVIPKSNQSEKQETFQNMVLGFDTEDDSGISDVSTSPKQVHLQSHRNSVTRHLSYKSQSSHQSEGTLIKVLLPENLRHFSEKELEMCRRCPNTRFQVIAMHNEDRTLRKVEDIFFTKTSAMNHGNKHNSMKTPLQDINVCAEYLIDYIHDRQNSRKSGLRRVCSDVTELRSENLYEEIPAISGREHAYENDARCHGQGHHFKAERGVTNQHVCGRQQRQAIEHDERVGHSKEGSMRQGTGKDLASLKQIRRMSRQLNEPGSYQCHNETVYSNIGMTQSVDYANYRSVKRKQEIFSEHEHNMSQNFKKNSISFRGQERCILRSRGDSDSCDRHENIKKNDGPNIHFSSSYGPSVHQMERQVQSALVHSNRQLNVAKQPASASSKSPQFRGETKHIYVNDFIHI